MSTIKSSAENLTLNADGANNDIKFQSNGTEVASIDQAGTLTATTFTGAVSGTTGTFSGNVGIGSGSIADNNSKVQINAGTGEESYFAVNKGGGYGGLIGYTNGAGQGTGLLVRVIPADPIIFKSNDTERLRILAAGGITFNGDTAAANALDDYEEGTFTPSFSSASSLAVQTGRYTKIGNSVSVQCVIQFVQSGTTFGSLTGLPFTNADVNYLSIGTREWYSTGVWHYSHISMNSTQTTAWWSGNNSSAATNGGTYGFSFFATYRTNS